MGSDSAGSCGDRLDKGPLSATGAVAAAVEMSSKVEDPRVANYRFMNGLVAPLHRYGKRWTPSEEHKAVRDYKDGIPIDLIAERLGRSIYATQVRVYGRIGKWKCPARRLKINSARRA